MILNIIQVFVGLNVIYQISLYFIGFYRRKEKIIYQNNKRFACIIPAHNEENVIANLVYSLKKQDYKRTMYDIFVICDNCSDNTAKIAVKAGAKVWIREDKNLKGKQWALKWAFEQLKYMYYDAVCVFDADNIVDKDFLKVMNDKLCKGNKLIQGYLDTKNPGDTWITKSYAISYWISNRISQLARYNVGLPAYLGGTGFCVDMELIKKYSWNVTTLVDDLEYSIQNILHGIKPTFAYDARVYDEKPLTLKASMKQRLRWMQGQADCILKYSIPLIKKILTTGSFIYIDSLMYLYNPLIILLNQLIILYSTLNMFIGGTSILKIEILLRSLIFQVLYMVVPLLIERVKLKDILGVIYQPIYMLTWIPLVVIGFIKRGNKEWVKTEHVRNINI